MICITITAHIRLPYLRPDGSVLRQHVCGLLPLMSFFQLGVHSFLKSTKSYFKVMLPKPAPSVIQHFQFLSFSRCCPLS